MLSQTAIMKKILEFVGVESVSELWAETEDVALNLVNRQIAKDLCTIDSAESRALSSAQKLQQEQEAFTAALAKGRVDNASWLTHYATEIANRMAEVQKAQDNILATAELRKALLDTSHLRTR